MDVEVVGKGRVLVEDVPNDRFTEGCSITIRPLELGVDFRGREARGSLRKSQSEDSKHVPSKHNVEVRHLGRVEKSCRTIGCRQGGNHVDKLNSRTLVCDRVLTDLKIGKLDCAIERSRAVTELSRYVGGVGRFNRPIRRKYPEVSGAGVKLDGDL